MRDVRVRVGPFEKFLTNPGGGMSEVIFYGRIRASSSGSSREAMGKKLTMRAERGGLRTVRYQSYLVACRVLGRMHYRFDAMHLQT